jgi:hypothetical protein
MKKHTRILRSSALTFAAALTFCVAPVQAEDVSTINPKGDDSGIEHDRDCRYDYNQDGVVGFDDFIQLLSRWAAWDPVTAEVTIGFEDIIGLLSEWGSC